MSLYTVTFDFPDEENLPNEKGSGNFQKVREKDKGDRKHRRRIISSQEPIVDKTENHKEQDEAQNKSSEININAGKESENDAKQTNIPREDGKNLDLSDTHHDSIPNTMEIATLCYRVCREMKFTWRGHRTHFQIFNGGVPLFHAKIKTISPDEVIGISKGMISHFSSHEYDGYLRTDESFTNFSLRVGNSIGTEQVVIRFFEGHRYLEPRSSQCFINIDNGLRMVLNNQKPVMDEAGNWSLNIPIVNIVPSIKNLVLLNDKGSKVITIGKVAKGSLQVDADERIPPLVIFAISISTFLCKL